LNVATAELAEPARDCPLCPRLVAFRKANRTKFPDYFNAPVPSFGPATARLLIVGLAPGLHGANQTGRPFTGDYAGDLLYATLKEFGFAQGDYDKRPDDTLKLVDARITNAVRCVPPENKPTGDEIRTCRVFLTTPLNEMPNLKRVVALGKIAHDAVVVALGAKMARHKFGHGRIHDFENIRLFDSYHCSRYNTNTGVLTPDMFREVFANVRASFGAIA
jgi:uracil-DNA glycosylase family 4